MNNSQTFYTRHKQIRNTTSVQQIVMTSVLGKKRNKSLTFYTINEQIIIINSSRRNKQISTNSSFNSVDSVISSARNVA